MSVEEQEEVEGSGGGGEVAEEVEWGGGFGVHPTEYLPIFQYSLQQLAIAIGLHNSSS